MYTQSSFICKIRNIQFRVFNAFHIFPFSWDSNKKLFLVNEKLQSAFNREYFLLTCLVLFQTFQLVSFISANDFDSIIFLYIMWVFNLQASVISWLLRWKLDNFLGFLNGTLLLGNSIARKILTLNLINFDIIRTRIKLIEFGILCASN